MLLTLIIVALVGMTTIEWTEKTWNPLVGCTKCSAGCSNCYAMLMSARIANMGQAALRAGKPLTQKQAAYQRVVMWERGGRDAADEHDKALPQWNNEVVLLPEALEEPLRRKVPTMYFVNSMSDLFHPAVAVEFIRQVFAVMEQTPQHTYQILTKRPERMREVLEDLRANGDYVPSENIWLGTSVEDVRVVVRIDQLRRVPAGIRFLSLEPLLGPLNDLDLSGIDWVIVGGESGRHLHELEQRERRALVAKDLTGEWTVRGDRSVWVRDLRDQCQAVGVAFFFKQWGGPYPKAGGRELDGRTWDEMPCG